SPAGRGPGQRSALTPAHSHGHSHPQRQRLRQGPASATPRAVRPSTREATACASITTLAHPSPRSPAARPAPPPCPSPPPPARSPQTSPGAGPPLPPRAGAGKSVANAVPAPTPTGAGMIVIPDVRGLHQYYKDLADRFAEVGVDSVAIDFFARTATTEDRRDKFDFMAQVPQTKPDQLQADIAAAVGYLRGAEGGQVRSVFSVGFCFGGALSYLQAASGLGYAGVIGFYGWPLGLKRWPDKPPPLDAGARHAAPVLSIWGGADEGIPPEAIAEF